MKIKIRREAIGLLVLISMVGSCLAASVNVGGWTFSADLGDEWRTVDNTTWSFDPYEEISSPEKAIGWEGVGSLPFYFPSFPNAPKDDEFYDSDSAHVVIYVLKIPEEMKKDIEEQNIRVYGSLDKVPEDQKEQDSRIILKDAARFIGDFKGNPPSEKDISFEDRTAHLIERDIDASGISRTEGVIAVALDANTVGIINVRGGTSLQTGGVDFDDRAWDIIEKFTIAPT
jgi:hypothetical protein